MRRLTRKEHAPLFFRRRRRRFSESLLVLQPRDTIILGAEQFHFLHENSITNLRYLVSVLVRRNDVGRVVKFY